MTCPGAERDTGFVLPGISANINPTSSACTDARQWSFPDGLVTENKPKTGTLTDLDYLRQSVRDILPAQRG